MYWLDFTTVQRLSSPIRNKVDRISRPTLTRETYNWQPANKTPLLHDRQANFIIYSREQGRRPFVVLWINSFFKVLLRMMKHVDFQKKIFLVRQCFFSVMHILLQLCIKVFTAIIFFFPLTFTMMIHGICENKVILLLIITDRVTRTIYHLA